ncbi:lysophospholipid acyltransferase family protein [Candidatus Kinetoplastidibacterium galati]|uniref:Lipid A biosynthesis (KDO)2-(Lauroyl)-lipid iva acyltransferase msbB n=1 Tax=Candidatus Kinetoplastidibacterium galati TCC219 TaxID=1208921 RepID=M1M2D7_9PROT|nr:lysophospholipid acyltransferase family protein [Candidatus Kinetoplastibacterium galatii]AGF49379.1 lipid A biosynthesis (KDO)2-(lauroyl)-lipid iva acyltransferase msbB [Candidatus Kinetoplastibacterium galatii TCC219]
MTYLYNKFKQFKIFILEFLFKKLSRLSDEYRIKVSFIFGYIIYIFLRKRVEIARKNLSACFPDLNKKTIKKLLLEHCNAIAISVIDRSILWYGDQERIKSIVSIENVSIIQDLIDSKKKVMVLMPHLLGMDAAGTILSLNLKTMACIYRPSSDHELNYFVKKGRSRFNQTILIANKNNIRKMIKHFSEYRPVVYLPDMDFGLKQSIFVPFFGVQTSTLTTTAIIAKKWDITVVPMVPYIDTKTGKYKVIIMNPLDNFPGELSVEEATTLLNQKIECWVRKAPSQYYWIHRRFKTRPSGEKSFY